MRSRAWLVAAIVVMAVAKSPMLEKVSAQSGPGDLISTNIVISELRFSGPNGSGDEFIELFNLGDADIEIGGWTMWASGASGDTTILRTTIPVNAKSNVKSGCKYLLAFGGFSNYSLNSVAVPDHTYSTGFAETGGVEIRRTDGSSADRVGFSPTAPFREGTHITSVGVNTQRSYERKPGGAAGHADTGNNANDFQVLPTAAPQNNASPCVVIETSVKPHQVQGNGAMSPMAGAVKTVKGVVTARAVDGFFIQTAVNDNDNDASTSDGLFVFTGGPAHAAAQVGNLVSVKGTVEEFVPPADPGSAPRTQLSSVTSVVDNGPATVPDAYQLTADDLAATGSLDQLEHLEGMRVSVLSLTAVSGTASDGVFYAVLTGAARPFRTAGVEAGYPVMPCAVGPCNVPLFDGNPERLRVDSDGLEGVAAAHVSTGAVMTNVTGVLDFGSRTYTLRPNALTPSAGMAISDPLAGSDSLFTVASFNATRFGDVSVAVWAAKAALALQSMGLPDVVALQGVDAAALQGLVNQSPGYTSLFVAGTDVAFLVNSRVSDATVEPVGDPGTFDRPSLLLHAVVNGPSTSLPQALAVLVNHLEPVNGNLAKRDAQAEAVAAAVHGLQQNNPDGAVVVVGDFNAFSFNDGYVDTVGAIRGVPAPPNQVAFESFSAVSPALLDLGATLSPGDQYSFVLNGNAQTHEHVLASANLGSQFVSLARPRLNGDFPDARRHDDTIPDRASAKDPVVASFNFPPDVAAPVIAPANDVPAEATGPNGAEVTFDTPAATDNLDDVVIVTCSPASGSVFPLGNTAVTCSASDLAGNEAEDVGFTVTVQDTTAPSIAVPNDITEEATSLAGRVVTYQVSASDTVSGSLVASCSPSSGSTFPIGTTEVHCLASDAAGNVGEALFSVNISRPVPGRMRGAGTVGAGLQRVAFTFEVGESTNFVERGWLMAHIKDGAGRPRYVAGMVDDVSFSNAEDFAPGQWPASGVDTVTFSGVGYWNGKPGYRFQVTATDRGEPGPGNDTFSLVVTSPTGVVVESTSGELRSGNIQSLR